MNKAEIAKIGIELDKNLSIKEQLDKIDNIVRQAARDGYYWSRLNILIGKWEKGKAVDVSFRGVKNTTYYQLEKETDRRRANLKHWHDTYKEYPEREKYITLAKKQADAWTKKALSPAHVSQASGENEWYTPAKYIIAAKAVMGDIDVDPASSEIANQIIQAKAYYTIQDDGLTKPWAGRVWMNPPYSQPLIVEFSETFARKYKSGEIKEACVLINNATETTWLQILLNICDQICFIKGRVKFIDVDGNASGSPLQGQLILYFGNTGYNKKFNNEFGKYGIIK